MMEYIKKHERDLLETLDRSSDEDALKALRRHHEKQIQWMQHERLIHLMVTLSICLFALLAFGFSVFYPCFFSLVLFILLLVLSVSYILHYYRLENSVQKWYTLHNQIREKETLSKAKPSKD